MFVNWTLQRQVRYKSVNMRIFVGDYPLEPRINTLANLTEVIH
jgi:hypothetical protein